jgi:predicted DNA-binding protein
MQSLKVTFTLPEYIVKELCEFSEELEEKKSHLVAKALEQYFDMLDLKLAKKRSEEVKNGKVKTVSFDEVKKELGIN